MNAFTEILPDALAQYAFPGLSVAGFVGSQSFAWSGGMADVEHARPVTVKTLFPIASCTKPITASLVMDQVRAGQFKLDDPLREIVSGFRMADPVAAQEMTVRDLLCHRTGLPAHTWAWVYGQDSREDFMRHRLPHLASYCPYQSRHAYSNIMYAFAGTLLERSTNRTWEQLVDPRFTQLDEKWFEHPQLALPYRGEKRIPFFHARKNHLIAPASELMASASTLAKWLREQHVAAMAVPQVKVSDRTQYGLGWRLSKLKGGMEEVWHSGQCSGYSAWMSSAPSLDAGIVLLANRQGAVDELEATAAAFYSLVQQKKPTLIPVKMNADPVSGRAAWDAITGSFKKARYENPGYGSFEIEGRQGWFQGQGPFDLLQDEKQRLGFELPIYGARFLIDRGEQRLRIPFDRKVDAIAFVRV